MFKIIIISLIISFPLLTVQAETLVLPESKSDSIIGDVYTTAANEEETLLDIGRRFDLGYDQIVRTNPGVDRWVPKQNARIVIPSRYILPDVSREGIVLNLAELRLYFYQTKNFIAPLSVMTFPVSIGRMDWKTPLGRTKIVKKERDPPWFPTQSLHEEAEEEGSVLPEMIPGGSPDNPLGHFALRLGVKNYLIHGTDERKSFGIGMRVTHGCIRMYPEDIEKLFELVSVGTVVTIIDAPVKVGWQGNSLFLEVHRPVDPEEEEANSVSLSMVRELIQSKADELTVLEEKKIQEVLDLGNGIPTVVGHRE